MQTMIMEAEHAGCPNDGRHLLLMATVHSDLTHLDRIGGLAKPD
jgi:hypothetical protein